MKRSEFDTGKPHQNNTVVWARRRLVDKKDGRVFTLDVGKNNQHSVLKTDQHGVLFADGVGLGKTWEALAASALLLFEAKRRRSAGQFRKIRRPHKAHVLVICPPGLITKWAREIRDPNGFNRKLTVWSQKHSLRNFVMETLSNPFQLHRKADLNALPAAKRRKGWLKLPQGTYVCSWNLFRKAPGSGYGRLSALRRHKWDILIVDEAHHLEARDALSKLENSSRGVSCALLLTATPFQLEPHEIHEILRGLLKPKPHKARTFQILRYEPVKSYVRALDNFFKGHTGPPSKEERMSVESTLKQLIARTPSSANRRYHLVNKYGLAFKIDPLEWISEPDLKKIVGHAIEPNSEFEEWYFKFRLRLANSGYGEKDNEKRTYVATKLRQSLSTIGQAKGASPSLGAPPYSPRESALIGWASEQIKKDLFECAKDGFPRKTLIFTSFVKVASLELMKALSSSFELAYKEVAQSVVWRSIAQQAPNNLRKLIKTTEDFARSQKISDSTGVKELLKQLEAMSSDPRKRLFSDLLGHKHYLRLVQDDLKARLRVFAKVLLWVPNEEEKKFHRYELRGHNHNLKSLASKNVVETYVGNDDRKERDVRGEAFRTPLGPWVLVASNVGSEGIDLHTFASHLVHFDVEWNPGKMEQREGRIDRLGRKLTTPINIYYLCVQGTYDERMLHQMVARQRWHSVLLGVNARMVSSDKDTNKDIPFLERDEARGLTLNLAPKKH
jgi:SNF2-related domain/Helicase conserved C-terminal domain